MKCELFLILQDQESNIQTLKHLGSSKDNAIITEEELSLSQVPDEKFRKTKLSLFESDKARLRDGHWLNTNLISAAQKLILRRFPTTNGLQVPMTVSKMSPKPQEDEFVQLLHVADSH